MSAVSNLSYYYPAGDIGSWYIAILSSLVLQTAKFVTALRLYIFSYPQAYIHKVSRIYHSQVHKLADLFCSFTELGKNLFLKAKFKIP